MLHHTSSLFLIGFVLISFTVALPSSADEIEIDPDALTVEGCQETGADPTDCLEETEVEEPEAFSVQLTELISGWLESLRGYVCWWLCR